jgi:hypothetical protein
MSVQSKTKRSKRKSNLQANVVMQLFLQETLAIRNLTTHIHELDQKLAKKFVSFSWSNGLAPCHRRS